MADEPEGLANFPREPWRDGASPAEMVAAFARVQALCKQATEAINRREPVELLLTPETVGAAAALRRALDDYATRRWGVPLRWTGDDYTGVGVVDLAGLPDPPPECPRCGAHLLLGESLLRWDGQAWQHQCPPPGDESGGVRGGERGGENGGHTDPGPRG